MKKIILLGAMLTAALSLTNCTKEAAPSVPETKVPYTIYANAPESRTTNDGLATLWAQGDEISVFHAAAGASDGFTNSKFSLNAGTSGEFSTENLAGSLSECNDWYVLYPYNSAAASPASANVTIGAAKDGVQTQNGNDSKAHIAGVNLPLWGKQEAVAKDAPVSVGMNQIASVIAVEVINETEAPVVVSTVSFTAPEDIVGTYTVNITGDTPVLTPGSVSNTAVLDVKDSEAIAAGGSATFYVAVKPFTAASGSTLTMSVNGARKSISLSKDVTFASGSIKPLKFSYKTAEDDGTLYSRFMNTGYIVVAGKVYKKSDYTDAQIIQKGANDSFGAATNNIYFVSGAAEITSISTSSGNSTNIVIIGEDADNKPIFNKDAYVYLTPIVGKTSRLVLQNVAVDASVSTKSYMFTVNQNYSSNGSFGEFVLEGCDITTNPSKTLYSISAARYLDRFVMQNCNVKIQSGSANRTILTTNANVNSFTDLIVRNNVFYCPDGIATDFKILACSTGATNAATTVVNMVVDNNTFVNIAPTASAMLVAKEVSNVSIQNNLLYVDKEVTKGGSYLWCVGTYPAFANRACGNNIYYNSSNQNFNMFYNAGSITDYVSSEQTTKLSESPLNSPDYETVTFTPINQYASYGAQR